MSYNRPDLTLSGDFCHIRMKCPKGRQFRSYHDKGNRMGKGIKSDPPLLRLQQVRYYLFDTTNKERKKRVSLAASARLSFPVFMAKEQWPMKGQTE